MFSAELTPDKRMGGGGWFERISIDADSGLDVPDCPDTLQFA